MEAAAKAVVTLLAMNLLVYFIKLTDFLNIEICALLVFCAAYNGISVQTFRDNLSVPSSGVLGCMTSEDEINSCPETLVRKCHNLLCVKSKKGADLIDIMAEA